MFIYDLMYLHGHTIFSLQINVHKRKLMKEEKRFRLRRL